MSDEIKIWSEELDPDYENSPHEFIGEISGKGYFSMESGNSDSFTGEYSIYRVYEKEDDGYEFWSEIVVPKDLTDVYIEYTEGWCYNFPNESEIVLASNRTLISFEDADGYYDLFGLLELDGDAPNIINEMETWELNEFDAFDGADSVLVKIDAEGTIGQNEDGIFETGTFNTSKLEFKKLIKRKTGLNLNDSNVISGFYSESLTGDMQQKMPKVGLVHIDVDLYSSAIEVLEFIKPLIVKGTVLVFDDWYCFPPGSSKGESGAMDEFKKKYPGFEIEEWKSYSTFGKSFFVKNLP